MHMRQKSRKELHNTIRYIVKLQEEGVMNEKEAHALISFMFGNYVESKFNRKFSETIERRLDRALTRTLNSHSSSHTMNTIGL